MTAEPMTPSLPVVLFGYHETLRAQIVFCCSKDCANSSFLIIFPKNRLAGHTEKMTGLQCPAVIHSSGTTVFKLSPVNSHCRWCLAGLNGSLGGPIKASGMLRPPGRNTECIINSTKSRVFSVRSYMKGCQSQGGA